MRSFAHSLQSLHSHRVYFRIADEIGSPSRSGSALLIAIADATIRHARHMVLLAGAPRCMSTTLNLALVLAVGNPCQDWVQTLVLDISDRCTDCSVSNVV